MHIRFNQMIAAICYAAWMVISGVGLGLLNSCVSENGPVEVSRQADANAQNADTSAGSIDNGKADTGTDAPTPKKNDSGQRVDSGKTRDVIDARVEERAAEAGANAGSYAFSIYLLKDSNKTAYELSQKDMGSVELQENPILTESDISYYNWSAHAFGLADNSTFSFPKPVLAGTPFVVISKGRRLYLGALWTPISSMMWLGPIIQIDPPYDARNFVIAWVHLDDAAEVTDPREQLFLKEALREAGKLVDGSLPKSMKGYEIYSWKNDVGQWQFTLITGTNRNKSCAEITTDPDTVSADGWVNITSAGVDAFKATLARLPKGESIFWWSGLQGCDLLGMPSSDIVLDIRLHCEVLGLELTTP
jgi:hypothetical protein